MRAFLSAHWSILALWCLFASLIDFALMGLDKRKARREDWRIPEDTDYDRIDSLRIEARQKLKAKKPLSLSQAGRIPGVNPADVAVLMVWLKRRRDAVEANDTREREQP